jgi:uncharacterized protein (DUF1697 family)
MTAIIAMLRSVNVGGNNIVKMETLRQVFTSLGCADVQTYVQSGNVVFRHAGKATGKLAARIEDGFEQQFGFRVPVMLRSLDELQRTVERNPFPGYAHSAPAKLHVNFLYTDPGDTRREVIRSMPTAPEELRIEGREIYVYYPEGAGQSKLRWAPIDKALGTQGTARNWNTVLKLLEMAEALE